MTVSEMLCDEVAVKSMNKEEKTDYMRCIIAAAEQPQNAKKVIMTLGATKGLTKERMMRIMGKNEKKIWKRGLTAGIMVLCFVFSSIPALAYEEPLGMEIMDADTIDEWKRADIFMNGTEEKVYIMGMVDFSQGEYIFMNEADEIFFVTDSELDNENQTRVICIHSYESGSFSNHESNGDGGCTVITYSAKKCSKCGHVDVGTRISTITYDVCPHK